MWLGFSGFCYLLHLNFTGGVSLSSSAWWFGDDWGCLSPWSILPMVSASVWLVDWLLRLCLTDSWPFDSGLSSSSSHMLLHFEVRLVDLWSLVLYLMLRCNVVRTPYCHHPLSRIRRIAVPPPTINVGTRVLYINHSGNVYWNGIFILKLISITYLNDLYDPSHLPHFCNWKDWGFWRGEGVWWMRRWLGDH